MAITLFLCVEKVKALSTAWATGRKVRLRYVLEPVRGHSLRLFIFS